MIFPISMGYVANFQKFYLNLTYIDGRTRSGQLSGKGVYNLIRQSGLCDADQAHLVRKFRDRIPEEMVLRFFEETGLLLEKHITALPSKAHRQLVK